MPQFVSPGASAGNAIQQFLMQREAEELWILPDKAGQAAREALSELDLGAKIPTTRTPVTAQRLKRRSEKNRHAFLQKFLKPADA